MRVEMQPFFVGVITFLTLLHPQLTLLMVWNYVFAQ